MSRTDYEFYQYAFTRSEPGGLLEQAGFYVQEYLAYVPLGHMLMVAAIKPDEVGAR